MIPFAKAISLHSLLRRWLSSKYIHEAGFHTSSVNRHVSALLVRVRAARLQKLKNEAAKGRFLTPHRNTLISRS